MKRAKFIFILIFAIFVVSAVALTIEAVTSGAEVAAYGTEAEKLSASQRELKDALVSAVSVSGLEEKSAELGFVKAQEVIYINDNEPVAIR